MEEMFEESDMDMINELLELPKGTSYTMGTLYYSKNKKKLLKEIKSKVSSKTNNSFGRLDSMIKIQFGIAQKNYEKEKVNC